MATKPTPDELRQIAHEPDGETARRWAVHIEADPVLKAELATMRAHLALLRAPVSPPDHRELIRARNRFILAALATKKTVFSPFRLAAAFGLLALLLVVGVMFWPGSDSSKPPVSDPASPAYLALRPPRPDAQPLTGRIEGLQGDAAFRVGEALPQTLTADKPIESGFAANLDPGASFFAKLRPGVAALVNEATLTVVRLDTKDIIIDLLRGSVALKVAPLERDQTVIVRTPEVSVAVTGTYFAVAYDPETGNTIAVREGRVAVTPHVRPGAVITVEEGRLLLIDSSLTAIGATLKEPDKTDRFFRPAELRDRAEPLPGQIVQYRSPEASSPRSEESTPAVVTAPEKGTPTPLDTTGDPARLLANARESQGNRRFDEALTRLEDLLVRHPKSPQAEDALYLKAENLIGLGRVEEALKTLADVEIRVSRDDLKQAALYTQAHLLQERVKDIEAAQRAWTDYLARYPEGMLLEDAMFGLCANRALARDLDATMERCATFVKRFGRSVMAPQALILAGEAAWESEDYEYASLYYGLYVTTDRPEHRVQALLRQAEALIRVNRPDRARTVLDRFMNEYAGHPREPEARRLLDAVLP